MMRRREDKQETPGFSQSSRSLRERMKCLSSRSLLMPSLVRSRPGRLGVSYDHLVKRGKFSEIAKKLERKNASDLQVQDWLAETCVGGETALHKLLRHKPPRTLVNTLIKKVTALEKNTREIPLFENAKLPTVFIPEEIKDDQGRNPLHIAAAAGCHVEVVGRLLDGHTCTMPAMERDEYGRYPLHWSCTNPSGTCSVLPEASGKRARGAKWASTMKFSSRELYSPASLDNVRRVMCKLIGVFPEALCLADNDGFTPIDLAKQARADDSILKLLSDASALFNKASDGGSTKDTDETSDMPMEVSHNSAAYDDEDDVSSLGADETPRSIEWKPIHQGEWHRLAV